MRYKEYKGDSQWWSFRSNYHKNQHFPVNPTNIQIIKIAPSSWARNIGNHSCAHLLMYDKMYHFMKSSGISFMILATSLCYPPFPIFISRKWKLRCANSGLFRIQPHTQPPSCGLSEFVFVADKLNILIRNSGRTIPALTVILYIFLGFSSEN